MHSVWDLAKTIFIEHDFQYACMLPIDLGQNEIEKKESKIFTNEIVQLSSWMLKYSCDTVAAVVVGGGGTKESPLPSLGWLSILNNKFRSKICGTINIK